MKTTPAIGFSDLGGNSDRGIHVRRIRGGGPLQNSSIPPHRHRELYQLFVVAGGSGQVTVDDDVVHCTAPWTIWLPADAVHSYQLNPDLQGHLLTVSANYLVALTGDKKKPLANEAFFESFHSCSLPQSQVTSQNLTHYLDVLSTELDSNTPDSEIAVESLLKLILVSVVRTCSEHSQSHIREDANRKIFVRFRQALEKHYKEHLSISEYARLLCVREQRLHAACRAATERSPQVLLHDRLVLEARREILYTSLSVSEIAFDLGFEDPAYFSRFFSKRARSSPLAYRRQGEQTRL